MLTVKEKKKLNNLYRLLEMHDKKGEKMPSIEAQIRKLEAKDCSN